MQTYIMEKVPLHLQKWVKECIKEKFETEIEKGLESDGDSNEIAKKLIESKEMGELISGMKSVLINDCYSLSRASSTATNESRPQTSMSVTSDLSNDDWAPMRQIRSDHFTRVANKMSYEKPIHVRLAGYEALARSEMTNIGTSQSWDLLLKTLRDGIGDESQAIFEASLQAHAMLLNGSQAQQEVFTNLLSAFSALYHSKRLQNLLPTLVSGINFKIFLHEKLFRVMYLIIKYQEESLKSNRNTDKLLEEVMEQFTTFLSSHSFGNSNQTQTLTALNIISVLEPESDWSRKWAHSLTTMKTLTAALAKSPALLQSVIHFVRTGAPESRTTLAVYVADEPPEVNISGDTVHTATYLHCLHLLTELCCKAVGRQLLTEFKLDEPFNIPDFMLSLLNSLNVLAVSEAPASVYNSSRSAMRKLLNSSSVLYDARFYKVAIDPLLKAVPQAGRKIHPHTIDVMMRALDTEEGSLFIISMSGELPFNYKKGSTIVCPATAALEYTSDLLQQPLSIMSLEHVLELFKLIGILFDYYDVCQTVKYLLRDEFYPAIARFYNKMDKYSVENEIKKETLNGAIKSVLLKTVSMPFALELLTREEFVFEELLRGSVEPLKSSLSCNDVVTFVSSAALLPLGFEILDDLAPHFLSKVLTDVCKNLEDPRSFHDPWEDPATKEFLHILRIFSLNNPCFIAIFNYANQENSTSDDGYPSNTCELLKHSVNPESPYHQLALMALNVFIHNLDANIILNCTINFQELLLELQNNCIIKTEIDDGKYEILSTIDEGSLLRHKVLLDSYYIASKVTKNEDAPEGIKLFSKFPPPDILDDSKLRLETSSSSELGKFLKESKPGLRDTGWVSQARKAHKMSSKDLIEDSVLFDLLDQMEKAIPTLALTSNFEWPETDDNDSIVLLPEEIYGIELVMLYAEQNKLMKATESVKHNLKIFLREVHGFIEYKTGKYFEGFDWFAATIFIICQGNLERCKTFVTQLVKFPSIIFVWQNLGKSITKLDNYSSNVQITFSHLLEGIIANELPNIKFALKNNCSVNWWMICDGMISHFFWGTIPWCEIVNLITICILYPPDYTLYYCVSLLHYCQNNLMEDVTAGNMWPENMNLKDYRSGEHFQLMDLLSKRYRNAILPLLMEQETQ